MIIDSGFEGRYGFRL